MRKWILIVAMCLISLSAFADSQHTAVVLSDFENQTELSRFSLRGMGKSVFTLSRDSVANGGSSGSIVFPKWQPGGEQWPAITLRVAGVFPSDWTNYDCFAFRVGNQSVADVDLGVFTGDSAGGSTSKHFIIPSGKTQTIRCPLYEIDLVNLSRVREISLYVTRPKVDTPLVFDFLRIEEDLDSRLEFSARSLAKLKSECKLPEAVKAFSAIESAIVDVRARLAKAESAEARDALRPEVFSIEQRVKFQAPRAISEARMRADFRRMYPQIPYACGFATAMEKVFPVDVPFNAQTSRSGSVELAGNETESIQLLILADDKPLKDVQVKVSPLVGADGQDAFRVPTAQASPMGFVNTPKPPYWSPYVGWYPDPILDFLTKFDIKQGEMQPVWIRVNAPAGTPAGEYRARITVQPTNAPAVELGLSVNVWGFDLPSETHLRTAVNFGPGFLETTYGELTEKMRLSYYDFLLKYKINPDSIYRADPPKINDLVRWNGRGMNAFNLIYVTKLTGIKAGDPYPAEKKKQIFEKLDAIIPQLKEKGLYSKAYVYGFDEIRPESFAAMKDIFSEIKAKYPDLPLMTTAYDATYGEATGLDMVDAWVPLTPSYNLERAAKARAKGKQVWWYICIGPKAPYANWLIEYDAIDARSLMGLQIAKYQPDGFLYYATNRWPLTKKPITEGPYTDWPTQSCADWNGDGSLMCAGPDGPLATIRLENFRDGLEDNEYFWLIRQEIAKLKNCHTPQAMEALRHAEDALKIGDNLVASMTSFSKSPEAIYAKRRQVAEAIIESQKALN